MIEQNGHVCVPSGEMLKKYFKNSLLHDFDYICIVLVYLFHYCYLTYNE